MKTLSKTAIRIVPRFHPKNPTPNLYIYFPGNALSMIVLSCPEMQNNFNHLLIGLSSFDTIYLLLSTLIFAMPKLSDNYAIYLLPHIMPTG